MTDRKPLGPVGIAQPLLAMSATEAEYTTAIFKVEDVPAGAELFIHPKDSRLRLEVEVANENAQHWKGNLGKANKRGDDFRTQRNNAMAALVSCRLNIAELTGISSAEHANKILEEDSWRSGETSAIARLARIYLETFKEI